MKFNGVLRFSAAILVGTISLLAPHVASAQASACAAGETLQTFAFQAGDWPGPPATGQNGSLGPLTFNVGTGTDAVSLTFTIVPIPPVVVTPNFPLQATLGGVPNVPHVAHNNPLPAGGALPLSTTNLVFSRPVNKLRWTSMDVDMSTAVPPAFQDVILPRANGTVLPTSMVSPVPANFDFTVPGTAVALGNCPASDANCNLTASFNVSNILSTSLRYESGPNTTGPGPTGAGNTQFIGWSNFEWCLPAALPPEAVPTLSEWAMILLAGLLAASAALAIRRSSAT